MLLSWPRLVAFVMHQIPRGNILRSRADVHTWWPVLLPLSVVTAYTLAVPATEAASTPWITSKEPLTLLSANDGQAHIKVDASSWTSNVPLRFERTNTTRDSITVIHLGPDHPPVVKTVYGTVPNTIFGAPYLAMSPDGRYGFVTCSTGGVFTAKAGNIVSVVDLASDEVHVVQTVPVPSPVMAVMHPDGKHLIVGCGTGFQVFELTEGRLVLRNDNRINHLPDSMDISPNGDRLVATVRVAPDTHEVTGVHVFSYQDGTIAHQHQIKVRQGLPAFDQPFALRFSPDGKRVLVPNGAGFSSKGRLDDILIVDMTIDPPEATDVIPRVADGIESLAFHPSGRFVVVACLEDFPGEAQACFSHLAVADLTTTPPRLLYHLDVEPVPEGIEFSPDGSQLFVQLTAAHRIAVYDVDGFRLTRNPCVIRVGHGPSSMGLSRRLSK